MARTASAGKDTAPARSIYYFSAPVVTSHIGTTYFKITHTDVLCNNDKNGNGPHWNVQGVFEQKYLANSVGIHGDLQHCSLATIFMEP